MSTIVNSQHLILAGNGVGVSHDNTLSGNGTFESPLGALFPEVSHDSTLSGNGLTTPLTVNFPTILHDDTISGNGYTEALGALIPPLNVNTDNTLTGDGNSTPLGLSSEQNLNKVTLGSTIVSSNKIQMMDNDGVVTVTPTQIRQWDSNSSSPIPVTLDNLKFASVPGDADLSNATATISNRNTRYQFNISNEIGNHAEFTMIPTGIGSGFLYMSGANVSAKPIDVPTCSAYAIDVGEDGIDFVIPDYCNQFTFTTPSNDEYHGGSSAYRVKVDGLQMNVASGAYVTLYRVRTYAGRDTTEWRYVSGNSLPVW